MRIEQLELVLRRRNPWEALDLGLVMLRQWHRPVYRAWFATYLPFCLLISGALWSKPAVAATILWWSKPLFDRILLKVFAEASFGAPPPIRAVWRSIPGLIRHSGLFAGLTFRRFNANRSFDLPVWQLEGQRGKSARNRRRVLSRRTSGYAFWLTFVCVHIVAILTFGFVWIFEMLTPSSGMPATSWLALPPSEYIDRLALLFCLASLIADSIVEPYFVAAGFSLYLNRRSDLEGWDIEVAFRRMAERIKSSSSPATASLSRAALIVLLAGSLSWGMFHPGSAQAEISSHAEAMKSTESSLREAAPPQAPAARTPRRPDGQVKRIATKILADPVFGHAVDDTTWRPLKKPEKNKPTDMPWWMKKLIELADMLAIGVRWLIYALVAIGVAILLIVLYRYRHLVQGIGRPASKPVETLFGLDLRPASLPDDIAAAALAELEAGRIAAALSLLYRGTLVALIHRRHIEFRAGDTEDSCLRRASGQIEPEATRYFAQLLDAWKRTAYAQTPPDAATARDLCQQWARHFATRSENA